MNNQRNVSSGTGAACPPGDGGGGAVRTHPSSSGEGPGTRTGLEGSRPPPGAPRIPRLCGARLPGGRGAGAGVGGSVGGTDSRRGGGGGGGLTPAGQPRATQRPPRRLDISSRSPRSQVVWVQIPSPHSPAVSSWASDFTSPRPSVLPAACVNGLREACRSGSM